MGTQEKVLGVELTVFRWRSKNRVFLEKTNPYLNFSLVSLIVLFLL